MEAALLEKPGNAPGFCMSRNKNKKGEIALAPLIPKNVKLVYLLLTAGILCQNIGHRLLNL